MSFYTPPGHKVESVVDATFVGIDNPALKGTLRFDWLRPGDEKGLYTFAFRSGVKVPLFVSPLASNSWIGVIRNCLGPGDDRRGER